MRLSIDPIPPSERGQQWTNFVSDIFFPVSASFSAPERFRGSIENWDLGPISLSRFDSAPVRYDREPGHLRAKASDDVLITFATESDARFTQGKNDLYCQKNGFFIQRGELPFQFSHADDNRLWVLKIPSKALKSRVRVLDRYVSYTYDSSSGVGALLLDTARSIPARIEELSSVSREGLGHCLIDLLCMALEDDERALGSGVSSVRLGHLARVERYIRANLANRKMSIEEIANANGISGRYLHDLFNGSDTTVGQWIRTLRLDAAHRDLENPDGGSIAEIAYRWGFGDQAQFSRHFKSRYGKTPREVKTLPSKEDTASSTNAPDSPLDDHLPAPRL